MPELPEVETLRLDLEKVLLDKEIISLDVLTVKTAKNGAAFFKKKLVGQKIKSIARKGKLLIFEISRPDTFLLAHLKMTGQFIYLENDKKIVGGHSLKEGNFFESVGGSLPNKHTRIIFNFVDGSALFFNDLRKFGYLKIVDRKELNLILLNNYGPEPLTPDLSLDYLRETLKKRARTIKAVLLDQRIVAGLGNIYVDEALFLSGILPERKSSSLKLKEIISLIKAINQVIALSLKHRGTTFKDFRDAKGNKGNFSKLLKVYGRGGKKCYNCGTEIKKIKVAGRGTHYCPICQK